MPGIGYLHRRRRICCDVEQSRLSPAIRILAESKPVPGSPEHDLVVVERGGCHGHERQADGVTPNGHGPRAGHLPSLSRGAAAAVLNKKGADPGTAEIEKQAPDPVRYPVVASGGI